MPVALQRSRECLGPNTQTRVLTRAPLPGFGTSLQHRPRTPSWPQSGPNTGRRTMSASSTSYLSLISSLETHRGRSAASTADGLPGHCSALLLHSPEPLLFYGTKLRLPNGTRIGAGARPVRPTAYPVIVARCSCTRPSHSCSI